MKKLLIAFLLLGSCKKPEPVQIKTYEPHQLSGRITIDKTLSKDTIWELHNRVSVVNGATLTIEPGTVIKAAPGSGSNASTLIITTGSKIMALGTKEEPIIFTSIQEAPIGARGLWGGVIILGEAIGSFSGNVDKCQIDGIPASDSAGLYGGNNNHDNSGIFQYVSIRHGGTEIGEGNEINGLTLGCVGDGTIVDNIEVMDNVDDGIEFFGGTVNATNLLIWGQGDDGLDIDQGFAGTISNAMIVLTQASDHALEIDGPEGAHAGSFMIDGVTIIGATENCNALGVDGEIADFRKAATGICSNILVQDFALGKDVELDNIADATNYANGTLNFINWEVITNCGVNISDIFKDKSNTTTFTQDASNFASIVTNPTVGCTNDFEWTYYKNY
tara:strand:- start:388 stop:1554 length:1167 start_codon:yes stop_codon:yes gene_type:complete